MPEQNWHFHVSRLSGNRAGQPVVPTHGVFLRPDATEVCKTLERGWLDADGDGKRDRGKSRFVPGLYNIRLRKSKLNGGTGKRSYDVFQFLSDDGNPLTTSDTPDADAAQLHIANHAEQLEGCIALGLEHGEMDGDPYAIKSSKVAYDAWHKEALALCATLNLDPETEGLWVLVTDDMP